jgi:beta-lactamase superfamily II metal-dependent hydrolase
VEESKLGGAPLLEVYFIDVGQGDGILIRTPDFRHIMIDGGHPRRSQPSGKSAADFVDWKFFEDYGMDVVALDAMIASHNDFDHYGGLADLLDVCPGTRAGLRRRERGGVFIMRASRGGKTQMESVRLARLPSAMGSGSSRNF